MGKYAKHLGAPVPQSEPLDQRQVKNSAGGFVYQLDDMKRLERFLILGAEGGTYYASERKLTLENARIVEKLVAEDGTGLDAVAAITEISVHGRAPKNEPALMALAIAAKKGATVVRQAAMRSLPAVARTGTHLFHFVEYLKSLGGTGGRVIHRGLQDWYLKMPAKKLALQAVKYQQRDGWSHRDVLRKARPKVVDEQRNAIVNWMVKGWPEVGAAPHPDEVMRLIWAFERAKKAKGKELLRLIADHGLPHECVPSEAKNDPAVWEAMLPEMGVTALIRNLGKMTSVGLLKPMSAASRHVREVLDDAEALRRGRVHPLTVLVALNVYRQGRGEKGSLTWTPDQQVIDALDDAFYLAFGSIEPSAKRTVLALDVSGSMDGGQVGGMTGITPRVGSAAMAMATARVEKDWAVAGFSHQLVTVPISPKMRLDQVITTLQRIPMGGTDCALPILWATQNKVPVDVFQVYTDNETWFGRVHPMQALKEYRQKMGIPAKLAVVGMTATGFTIADPQDAGTLDVVGFDTAAPAVMADWARQ